MLFRNLVTSLLEHERIETTEAKAKEIRGIADRMITLAKSGTLDARRRAASYLQSGEVVKKLFSDIGARFAQRSGGYTRLIKTRNRWGDSASMVVVELVEMRRQPGAKPAEKKPESSGKTTST
jgi:large subunit ribosomal protein L17